VPSLKNLCRIMRASVCVSCVRMLRKIFCLCILYCNCNCILNHRIFGCKKAAVTTCVLLSAQVYGRLRDGRACRDAGWPPTETAHCARYIKQDRMQQHASARSFSDSSITAGDIVVHPVHRCARQVQLFLPEVITCGEISQSSSSASVASSTQQRRGSNPPAHECARGATWDDDQGTAEAPSKQPCTATAPQPAVRCRKQWHDG
jgi:hypothetical protein